MAFFKQQQALARQLGLALALLGRVALLFSLTWIIGLTEPVISSAAPGRWNLTTTRWPPSSRARCTWPIVPAASGCGSVPASASPSASRLPSVDAAE